MSKQLALSLGATAGAVALAVVYYIEDPFLERVFENPSPRFIDVLLRSRR
jgi:hypothetical protein